MIRQCLTCYSISKLYWRPKVYVIKNMYYYRYLNKRRTVWRGINTTYTDKDYNYLLDICKKISDFHNIPMINDIKHNSPVTKKHIQAFAKLNIQG